MRDKIKREMAGIFLGFSAIFLFSGCTESEKERATGPLIVPVDFDIQQVASEPEIINPMTLAVDEKGAVYVSLSHTYRYGMEGSPGGTELNPLKKLIFNDAGGIDTIVTIAEGFENPVMGIAPFGDKIFVTNLNRLLVLETDGQDRVIRQTVLVEDSERPWNPFGMYRVIVGPDDKLWFSVGDRPSNEPVHFIGKDGQSVRLNGQSGGVLRCNMDGTELEVMVDGLRAPYAFEVDPWGHLWVISNGEGSPNIFFNAMYGFDYGYHSREVTYNWLAGQTALSPPVMDMGPGANTAVVNYRSSLLPDNFREKILISNWGNHGFNPENRILRWYDQKEDSDDSMEWLVEEEVPFLRPGTDSLFRPTDIKLYPDGSLLISDWHSRDDESNLFGRIYRIFPKGIYSGKAPWSTEAVERIFNSQESVELLDHSNHWVRERAMRDLTSSWIDFQDFLKENLSGGTPLSAVNSLWILARNSSEEAIDLMKYALSHPDARVRALGIRLLRDQYGGGWTRKSSTIADEEKDSAEYRLPESLIRPLLSDPVPEIRIEAALSLQTREEIVMGLLKALETAKDRYDLHRIGFELGRICNGDMLENIYDRLFPEQELVLGVCGEMILHKRPEWSSVVESWDIPALKYSDLADELVDQIRKGAELSLPEEMVLVLERLNEMPVIEEEFSEFVRQSLSSQNGQVRIAALRSVRKSSFYDNETAKAVSELLDSATQNAVQMEALYTLGAFRDIIEGFDWSERLKNSSDEVAMTALRALREGGRNPQITAQTAATIEEIAVSGESNLRAEAYFTGKALGIPLDDAEQRSELSDVYDQVSADLEKASAERGERVFFSKPSMCAQCHAINENISSKKLGPNLNSMGAGIQSHYLIQSILEPAKIIKTGYEMEQIQTKDGESYTGKVESEEEGLIIYTPADEMIHLDRQEVRERKTLHISLMPSGYDRRMSPLELADLVKYLISLNEE